MQLQLLNGVTAVNSPPTAIEDGEGLEKSHFLNEAILLVVSTAGSVVMDVTIRLWVWSDVTAIWHPLGAGADATKGTVNDGAAMGETTADQIAHSEIVVGIKHLDRIYAEVTAINGTATAIDCFLISRE